MGRWDAGRPGRAAPSQRVQPVERKVGIRSALRAVVTGDRSSSLAMERDILGPCLRYATCCMNRGCVEFWVEFGLTGNCRRVRIGQTEKSPTELVREAFQFRFAVTTPRDAAHLG